MVLYNFILQFQFKSNYGILLNKTFKSFWMINVNTIHIVRPEKFQFLEKWQNRNFDYEILILVKNPKFIL